MDLRSLLAVEIRIDFANHAEQQIGKLPNRTPLVVVRERKILEMGCPDSKSSRVCAEPSSRDDIIRWQTQLHLNDQESGIFHKFFIDYS